jgi:hypothetical protein
MKIGKIVFIFTYVNFISNKINNFLFNIFDTGKSPTPLFDINIFLVMTVSLISCQPVKKTV